MRRQVLITAGLLFAFAGFGVAQDQTAPADHPQGTAVTGHDTDAIVQPKTAPIKVTPSVIKDAQQRLSQAGYNAGPADGVLGVRTRAAINNFQRDKNLAQTGQLDQPTLGALNVGGVQAITSAPTDLGRGGKAIGHNVKEGHPVEAGKAGVKSGKDFGKKVGSGSESLAVKAKDKVGSGVSAIGKKITGAGEKTKEAGEDTSKPQDQQ